jgi:hypothetical protein
MFRHLRSALVTALCFVLIVLAVMAPGTSSVAPAMAAGQADFLLSIAYRAPYMSGYLVRGDNKVLYPIASYSGWFWSDNYFLIISRNGFEGNVTLEALNLPSGVTSEMPNSVFVPKGKSVTTLIRLRAATNAALGAVTVTLRGTSGTIVHTGDLSFTVVDQLPPLPA